MTDAHGPVGSRGPRGGTDKWYPEKEREQTKFDADKAARDAERNKGKGGK